MDMLRCMGSKFCVKFQRCPQSYEIKSLSKADPSELILGVKLVSSKTPNHQISRNIEALGFGYVLPSRMAADAPIKFQSDTLIFIPNRMASETSRDLGKTSYRMPTIALVVHQ